uniref:NADH dehydrogenase subunit 6 n=1 Tax=Bemisia afer TaxID=166114 RepID=A0A0U2GVN3_BEMAF|nr:NADH dehydrogenase subunit 6 [Bemisia afer]
MEFLSFLVILGMFNPVVLIIMFIFILILVILFLSFVINTYFYSYLVLMLFMSGIVVLLMYMCGIILIEKMLMFYKLNGLSLLILVGWVSLIFMNSLSLEISCYLVNCLVYYFEFISVMKFIYFPFSLFSLFFIIYLFICLVVIYEIVKKCSGPLRMKN